MDAGMEPWRFVTDNSNVTNPWQFPREEGNDMGPDALSPYNMNTSMVAQKEKLVPLWGKELAEMVRMGADVETAPSHSS